MGPCLECFIKYWNNICETVFKRLLVLLDCVMSRMHLYESSLTVRRNIKMSRINLVISKA